MADAQIQSRAPRAPPKLRRQRAIPARVEPNLTAAINGISHVRLSAPDLGRMEDFLVDFGMVKVHRDDSTLYMRGIGPSPYLHVTELGEPGVLSFGYEVAPARLADIARLAGASGLETLDAPGGGQRVRLRDPDGLTLEFLAGRKAADAIPERARVRGADATSQPGGAARVRRISHTAYKTPDLTRAIAWYTATLGLLPTDELYIETPDNVLGRFLRVDAGDQPVDHHTIFLLRGPQAGLHHVSYEVEGVDDIFFGYDHMVHQSHDHVRGIGRHALGSQIFNYWMSPFGQMHEHWISSEKMTAASRFNRVRIGEGMAHDSGDKPPERFVKQATPVLAWTA